MELSERTTGAPILPGKFPTITTHDYRSRLPGRRLLLLVRRTRFVRGQAEGDVLARVVAAADRDDDVLLAVDRIGHRRAALWRWHPDLADLRTGLLVVRVEHRTARASRRRRELRVTCDDERRGHHQGDA